MRPSVAQVETQRLKQSAAGIALAAAAAAGFEVIGPLEALRIRTNGVFEVPTADGSVVARVAGREQNPERLQGQLEVAAWLSERGFATSRPLTRAPISHEGNLVTFWEKIDGVHPDSSQARRVGQLLHRFHELTDEYPDPMGPWLAVAMIIQRLDDCEHAGLLDADLVRVLRQSLENINAAVLAGSFGLRPGIIHGDAHLGNVLINGNELFLIDLDRIGVGPREWDTTPFFFNRDTPKQLVPAEADAFVDGFGWEPRDNAQFTSFVVELHALSELVWLLAHMDAYQHAQRQIDRRIRRFTERDAPPQWD